MELQSLFELLKNHFTAGLPFVIYKQTDANHVTALLQKNRENHSTTDFTDSGFVFAPFDKNSSAFLIPALNSEIHKVDLTPDFLVDFRSETVLIESQVKARENYMKRVQNAVSKIRDGAMEKVVLSRKIPTKRRSTMEKECSMEYLLNVFRKMCARYPTAFNYLWSHPTTGTWMGATPETLLELNRNRFRTMSLAGTRPALSKDIQNWGAKEIEEQQLVTDEIVRRLEAALLENILISERETVIAGKVEHLRTKISGTVNPENTGLSKLVYALHPTPAVCGLPRQAAFNFIQDNEGYDREFYTGFLGPLNLKKERNRARTTKNIENRAYRTVGNRTHLYVNLRCMLMDGAGATLFVGGGITASSDQALEWEETVNKSQTLIAVL